MSIIEFFSPTSVELYLSIGVAVIAIGGFLVNSFKNKWKEPLTQVDKRVTLLEEQIKEIGDVKETAEKRADKNEEKIEKLYDMMIQFISSGQHNIKLTRDKNNK